MQGPRWGLQVAATPRLRTAASALAVAAAAGLVVAAAGRAAAAAGPAAAVAGLAAVRDGRWRRRLRLSSRRCARRPTPSSRHAAPEGQRWPPLAKRATMRQQRRKRLRMLLPAQPLRQAVQTRPPPKTPPQTSLPATPQRLGGWLQRFLSLWTAVQTSPAAAAATGLAAAAAAPAAAVAGLAAVRDGRWRRRLRPSSRRCARRLTQ
jgi:hypothetical protein